jgi:hypothetical protein
MVEVPLDTNLRERTVHAARASFRGKGSHCSCCRLVLANDAFRPMHRPLEKLTPPKEQLSRFSFYKESSNNTVLL